MQIVSSRNDGRPGAGALSGDGSSPLAAPEAIRVLIVEDEWLISMEIEASLLDAGYEVVGIAATADEALDLARQLKPHIATMDIRLDGAKDGIDAACELFRQFGVRCLFISAHSTFLARGRADAARPLGWLSKPFTSSQLLDSFETALRAARDE